MRQIALFTAFANLLFISSYAQLSLAVPAIGKIDTADLKMTDCSFDPGAEAIYLLRYSDVTLTVFDNYRTQVSIIKRFRIKILKKSAFKLASISIDYNSRDSKISELEGATYNLGEDGRVKMTAIDQSDIYKRKEAKKNKIITFTFPDVKEGSVLEYQFTQRLKDAFFIPSWYFQTSLPTVLSINKVSRPYYSPLQKRVTGEWPVEEESSLSYAKGDAKRELVNYYLMRNVPAFVPEPFISSSRDYRYRIDFLTVPEESSYDAIIKKSNNIWQGDNQWLIRHPYFGGQFDADIPGSKKFIDSVKRLDDVSAKIAAVYRYVKQKLRWNDYYFILSRDLKEVWDEGEGTSAEINLSILNLLRKCKVPCFPVLYSTRLHGRVDYNFPSLGQFNTVDIAVINGKKFDLLDGTYHYLGYDTPPLNVVNRTGMLIDPINHTMINIDFNRKLLWDSVYVQASIDTNGMMKGKIVKKYFDLAKTLKLQNESKDEEGDEDNRGVQADRSDITIDSSYLLDKDNDTLPLTEITRFHYELPAVNDFYLLSPFLFSNMEKNPFRNTIRKTDLDFIANISSAVHIEISLPREMKVDELTKDKEVMAEDSSITFSYHNEVKNNTIFIVNLFAINQPLFDKKDYPGVKRSFDNIYGLLNNQILLRKK